MVYKTAYAKNPFDNISDQELEEYRKIVERKQRGEPGLFSYLLKQLLQKKIAFVLSVHWENLSYFARYVLKPHPGTVQISKLRYIF